MYPEYVEMEEKTLRTSNPKIKKEEGKKIANKLVDNDFMLILIILEKLT